MNLHVGQAFQPAGSRDFQSRESGMGDWKAAQTGRQECPPCEGAVHEKEESLVKRNAQG
jgi:hypothetical protein